MPTPQELVFARFAVDHGLITPDEEQRCWQEREAQRGQDRCGDFKAAAEALGVLSPYQIAGIEVLLREHGAGDATPDRSGTTVSEKGGPVAAPAGEEAVGHPDSPTARDPGFSPRPASGSPPTVDRRAMLGGYTILRELGRGGMGIVYEAIQLRLNRRVALKVLVSREMDADGLERLKREALAAAKLTHPNLVQVYDAGEEDGQPYFAMEYVSGTSLLAWIGRPEMTRERAVRLILQAAEGLHVAHSTGIVHRDVKPANLLVGPKDRLVVTDFGLARDAAAATITHSNQLLGTPRYMSPEQANGVREEVDHRTDIYSLGATLYELVTGKPIFEDLDGNIFHQVLMRDPKPPRRHDEGISVDLETLILKATAKEASARYASMADFADDLRRYLEGRPVLARRASWWELSARAVRRHRLGTAAGWLRCWSLRSPYPSSCGRAGAGRRRSSCAWRGIELVGWPSRSLRARRCSRPSQPAERRSACSSGRWPTSIMPCNSLRSARFPSWPSGSAPRVTARWLPATMRVPAVPSSGPRSSALRSGNLAGVWLWCPPSGRTGT
jgi:serine/threonine protein kinase